METGYYMVDLAELMKQKRRYNALERMEDAYMVLATNNRGLDDAESKKYMQNISRATGVKQETKFNRQKFEELRAFTQGLGG
ncbi:hypothetical protein [Cytobacillus pseudoceanisediminis]|uniref:hypothetical protein n=1 Tax=Cytobacillus pseudoceanisediminis TaxID=3051614 RepID=UPI003CFAC05E